MITLNQKQKIIIAYHNKQKSQRAIAREVGLNRRTVARYIKDYDQKRAELMATAYDTQKVLFSTENSPIFQLKNTPPDLKNNILTHHLPHFLSLNLP
jgi:IS30 family transposase